jgi:hypothetical protein
MFCGACNPAVDIKALAKGIKQELGSDPEDVLLLLNACRTCCLRPDRFPADMEIPKKVVCVGGESVNGQAVPESELVFAVTRIIKELIQNDLLI